jgi:HlyD family secretion protein
VNDIEDTKIFHSIKRHFLIGFAASVLLIGVVGTWAAMTNIAGAIVGSGHFVVNTYVKKIQHPKGGIVDEILVSEGQVVNAGETLIRLDPTQVQASLAIVSKRLDELNARRLRLEAERDEKESFGQQDSTSTYEFTNAIEEVNAEKRIFVFRKESRESKKARLRERIAQFNHEIDGLKAQEVAYADGLSVLKTEILSLEGLRDKGAVSVQRLNSLKTQAATYGGERGEKVAFQAQVAGKITEAELEILAIDQDFRTEVGTELREVQAQIGEYVERKIAAEDDLKRINIISPLSGTIHELTTHTVGGVITPAETIMQIVPVGDELAIDVRIQPKDIDQVRVGQLAFLRLTAFNQRTTPQMEGEVSRVAADLTLDERTGMSYYAVRIFLRSDEADKLGGLVLVPGMPADVLIQTGDRTVLSYLMKPLRDQLERAFREE